ncbi:RNA-dependent RNA polymerase [Beihai narna-like virus 23]|uniref:RNA-dependent RNA polymerase n=1 Tax=Beihai narna-like virus 23 TaxID=1922451 RepID=UPI00090CC735|nr:RNA-dependent RNA polymerase [Beihai narna-like virus 23]APG77086.1 RNA-dependent RNA polymerase [Beihai narna-like virus 23]
MSGHFQRALSKLCRSYDYRTIQRWWYTVDGLVLPLLLTHPDPDSQMETIDRLIKFGFENCANNYSHFISRMKRLKKLLRKEFAEGTDLTSGQLFVDLSTYRKVFYRYLDLTLSERSATECVMAWTQARAAGLADRRMIEKSLEKAEKTLSTPRRVYLRGRWREIHAHYQGFIPVLEPEVPRGPLLDVVRRVANKVRGETAHISTGPHACLEIKQAFGGQAAGIAYLCKRDVLTVSYDPVTLERTFHPARPCASAQDLLSWAISRALDAPVHTRMVRIVAVSEPSKARTVTVGALAYQIILGVVSKIFQPALASGISRTGLEGTRNLYEALNNDFDPSNGLWGPLRDMDRTGKFPVFALTSDLEEATDYGDLAVARQILQALLMRCRDIPGFPLGLAVLAKSLFLSSRIIIRPGYGHGLVHWFRKRNGWLMGDRMTKVVLTLAHEIGILSAGIQFARICGDDVFALSKAPAQLQRYHKVMTDLGFKISEDDHFISRRILFYCEEVSLVPQDAKDLPSVCNRRSEPSCYVDYPRIRLLLPIKVETNALSYTDTGRFHLLGKEMRWVFQNSSQQADPFIRASLLQHIAIAMPRDILSPFLPQELAGDGAFPHSAEFLLSVIERKSINYDECLYRIHSLTHGKWGFRYLRADNINEVVHKYHQMVPKLKVLESVLPPDAVVRASEVLISSLKVKGLETPEKTFFRLYRSYYWYKVLHGMKAPVLNFDEDRTRVHGGREFKLDIPPDVLVERFYTTWRDSGFTF